jgi:hypothetical protein
MEPSHMKPCRAIQELEERDGDRSDLSVGGLNNFPDWMDSSMVA